MRADWENQSSQAQRNFLFLTRRHLLVGSFSFWSPVLGYVALFFALRFSL